MSMIELRRVEVFSRDRACTLSAGTPSLGSGASLQALRGARNEATETATAGTGGGRPCQEGACTPPKGSAPAPSAANPSPGREGDILIEAKKGTF